MRHLVVSIAVLGSVVLLAGCEQATMNDEEVERAVTGIRRLRGLGQRFCRAPSPQVATC